MNAYLHSAVACNAVTSLNMYFTFCSVDGLPTFELRWMHNGKYTHDGLADVFRDSVENNLLPTIRGSSLMPKSSDLVLCQALLRMYDDGQRRVHPAHYDAHALVTAVAEIDTADTQTQVATLALALVLTPSPNPNP